LITSGASLSESSKNKSVTGSDSLTRVGALVAIHTQVGARGSI